MKYNSAMNSPKILIIQTAFTGDVILATAMMESIHHGIPGAEIHFLLRKGNEGLFKGHPYLHKLLILDKKKSRWTELRRLIQETRKEKYDYVFNLQRYAASGIITAMSGAKMRIGYDKNPLSFAYTKALPHLFDGSHETERNHQLLRSCFDIKEQKQKLYPTQDDFLKAKSYYKSFMVCMAPSSVWMTKRLPEEKWIALIRGLENAEAIYLLGGPADAAWCRTLIEKSGSSKAINLAGELSYLESAALMSMARMNYVNDSAPLHMASAMNAPVRAFFCSTVPAFGFRPQSEDQRIIEVENLSCRPCGIHGFQVCPKKHFHCGHQISIEPLIEEMQA
jgi:heptosyltransferase-2